MSIGQSVRGVKGYPWTLPLVGFTAVFGGAGYAAMLDPINGPSIAAAWGILYMITCAGGAIRSRRPGPVALLGVVATSTGIYAREMLDLAD
ncbi:hypothetical protein HK105_207996 [Polyrhizophydium stewartii]|uniref:Uncharacterized protein n=1 Tax=Polyrhizophydium stewartii TaxID=2732419 RepID=A0ABR4MYZ6_9FUNG|nr:hypothetical protein HK105_002699 [Polyrhizophydium stewartii]